MMNPTKKLNPLFILGLLLLIFMGPLISAVVLYIQSPHWLTEKMLNKGQLISPALAFNTLKKQIIFQKEQHGPWQVVYLTNTDCHQICQQRLDRLQHVILALGKNRHQVNATLIQIDHSSTLKNKQINHYLISGDDYQHFFRHNKMGTGYYLVDPQGKIILYYSEKWVGEDLYQDLTRLLSA
jgi:cytochrome oxidase Cu insertion factor (SCO1/SenC/PrrC family)